MSKCFYEVVFEWDKEDACLYANLLLDDKEICNYPFYAYEDVEEEVQGCLQEFESELDDRGYIFEDDNYIEIKKEIINAFSRHARICSNKSDIESNVIKNIFDNTCYFSEFQIKKCFERFEKSNSEKKLPKSINLLTVSGDEYFARIEDVKVLEKPTLEEVKKIKYGDKTKAIVVFESDKTSLVIAVVFGDVRVSSGSLSHEFYKFKSNTTNFVEKLPVAFYSLNESSIYYNYDSPLSPVLIPVMEYYNLLQSALEKQSDVTSVKIDMVTLRKYYDAFSGLSEDDNLIVVPVIGKAERIRCISLRTESFDKKKKVDEDFYDASLTPVSKEDKESNLELLANEGVILPENTDLAIIDLINASERDVFRFRQIFANSDIEKCTVATNIKGERVRLDRVTSGVKNVLSGDVKNKSLVDTICWNDISCLNKYKKYKTDTEYTNYLAKAYPVLKNNKEQLVAIDKIVQMAENDVDIMLVQGPPGTGKTELILALAKELYKKNYNTLITSNVHVACDNIVDRLKNNKNLALKRYTTNRGDQYLSELVENQKKYVENQVLEGFKFNNIVIDSTEMYNEIKNIYEREKEKKAHILQVKEDNEQKINSYYALITLSEKLLNETAEIENKIKTTQSEIEHLEERKHSNRVNVSPLKKCSDELWEVIAEKTKLRDSVKAELSEHTQILNAKNSEIASAHDQIKEKLKYIHSLNNENAVLSSDYENAQEKSEWLGQISAQNIKVSVLAFIKGLKKSVDYRYVTLIPKTITNAEDLAEILKTLKDDKDFWTDSSTPNEKTIDFLYYKNLNSGLIKSISGQETVEKIEELHKYYKTPKPKFKLLAFLMSEFNGKPQSYYDECFSYVGKELKKIQGNLDDIISRFVFVEEIDQEIYRSRGDVARKTATIPMKIRNNEKIIERETAIIATIRDEITVYENEALPVKTALSSIRKEYNDINNEVSRLSRERDEKLDEINVLDNEYETIIEDTNKKEKALVKYRVKADENSRNIDENTQNLMKKEKELGNLINDYDSFVAKVDADIKDIDKKLFKYSGVVEKIEAKISELTTTGWLRNEAEEFIFNYVKELGNIVECDSKDVKNSYFDGRGTEFKKMFLLDDDSEASLVSMTTNQVATLLKSSDNLSFDYAIIDEASKCRFEDLIISLPRIKHLVLIGDFMQLDPMYNSYDSIDGIYQEFFTLERWDTFNKSSFSMLLSQFVQNNIESGKADFDENPYVAVMKRQYRMNKGIFNLIKPVYDIHPGFDLIDEKQQASVKDVRCINISGKEMSVHTSKQNIDEADAIIDFIKELGQKRNEYSDIKSIGIITGYKPQENYLRRKIKKYKIKGVQLGTFDRFQGREYDLVIISLVRTEALGFLDDVRRMNVAFSRAKKHLIVFGNFDALNKIALRNSKKPKNQDEKNSIIEEKESKFVLKTLIPKLYSLREDFVSQSDCTNELLRFLKENKYE